MRVARHCAGELPHFDQDQDQPKRGRSLGSIFGRVSLLAAPVVLSISSCATATSGVEHVHPLPQSVGSGEPSCPPASLLIPAGSPTLGGKQAPFALWHAPYQVEEFCLAKYEITRGDFDTCVQVGRCSWHLSTLPGECQRFLSRGNANLPMSCITHDEAAQYCLWKGGRLPTDIEWEYAGRGSDERPYPWGTGPCDASRGCRESLTPVGSFPDGASPFGVLDLASNVEEWTSAVGTKERAEIATQSAAMAPMNLLPSETWYWGKGASFLSSFRYRVEVQNLAIRSPESETARRIDLGARCAYASRKARNPCRL